MIPNEKNPPPVPRRLRASSSDLATIIDRSPPMARMLGLIAGVTGEPSSSNVR
jgi:hypothetical protein